MLCPGSQAELAFPSVAESVGNCVTRVELVQTYFASDHIDAIENTSRPICSNVKFTLISHRVGSQETQRKLLSM